MRVGAKESLKKSNFLANTNRGKPKRASQNKGLFWEARSRIFAWYGVLVIGLIGLSVPLIAELVFNHVDRRVRRDLVEELESFESFWAERVSTSGKLTDEDLEEIFQKYLYRQIPEDDTFLIVFLNGQFSRSSPRGRPQLLQEESELMGRWAILTKKEQGEEKTSDPKLGNIFYLATPVIIDGQPRGSFVIAHTTAGERQEAREVIIILTQVLLVGLVLVLILGWVASGKILAPLRSLASTALSISESNLNQRILVQGAGEMGELAATFNRMLDRLETAFNTQKAFINDASHELRTPIAIVRGHLELMGDDPQERQETIKLVIDELDRMNRMVNDLILLAKSERPDFLQWETIDMALLVQELYTKATALGKRHWQLDARAKGLLVGDRQRLTQAIMNLTENAVQHTDQTDTIAIGSELTEGAPTAKAPKCLRLWVRDTGVGIAERDGERIFERFARASNSRRRSDGSGLGLSIVRAITEAHGGRVEMVSQAGIGSTFTLVLPLEPAQGNLRRN
jgi:signal transduction histidine kinase